MKQTREGPHRVVTAAAGTVRESRGPSAASTARCGRSPPGRAAEEWSLRSDGSRAEPWGEVGTGRQQDPPARQLRSEERRVGKAGRYGWRLRRRARGWAIDVV